MSVETISAVRIGTGPLSAEVLADGGCIASLRIGGRELLLRTAWAGLDDGPPLPDSAAEWHRRYRGGWHLLLPRPLGPAVVGGIPQPFHGEAAWRRWIVEQTSPSACRTHVLLRTVPLSISRTIEVSAESVAVTTTVRNVGTAEVRFGWAEHPSLDAGLFSGGRVELDGGEVPVVPCGVQAFEERAVHMGRARIVAPGGLAIELRWDASLLARAYVWQERHATAEFPWYASADALAVEPASQPHDHPADELGTLPLGPAAELTSVVTLGVHDGPSV